MSRFRELFPGPKTIIAVCHLPPLPDYPGSPGLDALRAHALADLEVLELGGAEGILIENEYDRPHRVLAEAETVAAMTDITAAVAAAARNVRVGCEILLNDPKASLDVARASGARFIRSDYFVDRMMRPEYGEFEIDPQGLIDYRSESGAADVLILADIQVKYATMITARPLAESARIAASSGADAVVVTGAASGDPPPIADLREAAQGVPVLIGSGLDAGNAAALLAECDGAIVGTSIMSDGRVDAAALGRLMSAAALA
ncbi:MAG TPA: BtpA/SgcQ family protein [Afifellaceae bacterium]|nr:BtpA/SgcQ family protein [Afifellaceae bacterium]